MSVDKALELARRSPKNLGPVQAFADHPRRRAIHAEESFVSPASAAEFATACAIYDRAVFDLGAPHHWGASITDLLCDNMPVSTARARELAELIERAGE